MQNRNISSVLFRSRRAATLAAATTVVMSGFSVANAIDVPRADRIVGLRTGVSLTLVPSAFDSENRTAIENDRGGHAGGDAVRTYTGTAGTGLFSSPTNWTPSGAPVAGDGTTFGAAPAGNYTVTNDLQPTVFGDLIVNRTNIADTVTLNNGYRGNRVEVTRGGLIFNGGTTAFTSEINPDPAQALSIQYSVRAINGSVAINSGAQFTYNDFLHGSAGGTATVDIRGAGTVLNTASADGTTARSDFRGGGGGTSTVTITDSAVVNANFWLANGNDTTTISNRCRFEYLNPYTFGNTTGGRFGGQMEIGFFNNPPDAGDVAFHCR